MKSNKTGSIILMVMALVFAVIGTVFIFLEESASPIIVSGTDRKSTRLNSSH